jgi:hypothetical protein
MRCILLTAVAVAVFALSSAAEETAVHLNVRPMPAAKPALKYQLLPEFGELNPGNPAQNYLKCFLEQRPFFFGKEAAAERARYQALPLAELPVDKLREYGRVPLQQADWSARLDALDWQTLQRIQNGGIEVLPGELGPLQVLGAALQVRFRIEVAGRRFEDALRTAKTMFALARHLGEYPAEVANLVGLWVAHLGLNALEEMVQQPGCPNLYWALTDLPCPLVDLRKGVQGDRTLVAAELRWLRDDVAIDDAELEKFVGRLAGVISYMREQAGQAPRSLRTAVQAHVKDSEKVRAARSRLVEAGCGPERAEKLGPLQVILLDAKRDYEIQRDERMKILALPMWQIDARAGSEAQERVGVILFADLLPDVIKLRRTQAQLERQIALLRHVEALRLYAAGHDGKLPAKLADLSVPLPVDPVTGKSFTYTLEEKTAHLRGGVLQGEEKTADDNVHYQVAIQK